MYYLFTIQLTNYIWYLSYLLLFHFVTTITPHHSQSMCGRYASYWNAFLLLKCSDRVDDDVERDCAYKFVLKSFGNSCESANYSRELEGYKTHGEG